MRLKVFQAPNIGAAMAMVRDELGPDALILANRDIDGGVELTAAHEQPEAPVEAIHPPPTRSIPVSAAVPIASSDLARAGTLRWHGVPTDLATRLARGDLARGIEEALTFSKLPCGLGDAPLLLVGPPGAGKTLTCATYI